MRLIDRIFEYIRHHHLTPYQFERECGIANGYLQKQNRGKGTIGSEILEKISEKYKDISLVWLITGKGKMLAETGYDNDIKSNSMLEEETAYASHEHTIKSLRDKIIILESALADKEKIIGLLEKQVK